MHKFKLIITSTLVSNIQILSPNSLYIKLNHFTLNPNTPNSYVINNQLNLPQILSFNFYILTLLLSRSTTSSKFYTSKPLFVSITAVNW